MAFNKKLLNDRNSYGWGLISIHWIMALAIIGLYPLGLYIDSLTYYDPEYRTVPHWHKSIGILVLMLLTIRIIWRTGNKPPAELPQPAILTLATKAVHNLLYILMLGVLVSGYMISTADGRPIAVFNWFEIPALPALIDNQEDVAGAIHYWIATALVSLAALHALAALKHHFIDKDETLKRIFGIK
ncbi:cytochrome b [Marinobacterium jannaschii]|uniref:cytochrome b n=1 Tax=Marinobacterium jannaschii TaxID=64970 RepID=UPI000480F2D6|nr:cytochrome b [Marinobacterium jannaschii]